MERICRPRIHIQICCLSTHPERNFVDKHKHTGQGIRLRGAIYYQIIAGHERFREQDWMRIRQRVLSSIRAGDNAYVHCVSGLSRAPSVATLMVAHLMNMSVESAVRHIEDFRNTELPYKLRKGELNWVRWMLTQDAPRYVAADEFLVWKKGLQVATHARALDSLKLILCDIGTHKLWVPDDILDWTSIA